MAYLDLIRNLAVLIIADATEELNRFHSDEALVELECIEGLKAKAGKILAALEG